MSRLIKEFDRYYLTGLCKLYGLCTLLLTFCYVFFMPQMIYNYLIVKETGVFIIAVILAFIFHVIRFLRRRKDDEEEGFY